MIKPLLQDDAFLEDVHAVDPGKLHLWWLGQSGYLLKWGNSHLLNRPLPFRFTHQKIHRNEQTPYADDRTRDRAGTT